MISTTEKPEQIPLSSARDAAGRPSKKSNSWLLCGLGRKPTNEHIEINEMRSPGASRTIKLSLPPRENASNSKREKKIGHRRVDKDGKVTYKKTPFETLGLAMQHAIVTTLSASNTSNTDRDILMDDFQTVESFNFLEKGTEGVTPGHNYGDFEFKIYAANAFRYFRKAFEVSEADFLKSIGDPKDSPLVSLSNPGASGSLFWKTGDDQFIIKTIDSGEASFLKSLLPGYYMNLTQNKRTLLPKFYGLYQITTAHQKNIRLMVMSNLIPSTMPMHWTFDLKGSLHGRKASKKEQNKKRPVWKDLDWQEKLSSKKDGIFLDKDVLKALKEVLYKDVRVLQSFKIMDYSLLLAICNVDQHKRDSRDRKKSIKPTPSTTPTHPSSPRESLDNNFPPTTYGTLPRNQTNITLTSPPPRSRSSIQLEFQEDDSRSEDEVEKTWRSRQPTNSKSFRTTRVSNHIAASQTLSIPPRSHRAPLSRFTTGIGQIMESTSQLAERFRMEDLHHWSGGIPAYTKDGDRLLIYLGIIDILQHYQIMKRAEHAWKAVVYDGSKVSVCKPSFYAKRFLDFMEEEVFHENKNSVQVIRRRSRKNVNKSGNTGNLLKEVEWETEGDATRQQK